MKHWIRLLCLSLLSIVAGAASAQNVAKVGTTEYATLQAAVNAVPTDGTPTAITMIADATIVDGVTVAAGKNIVLDLNGKVLSLSKHIGNSGALTIQDGSGNGKIASDAGYTFVSTGTLTINSGTYSNTATDLILQRGGSITINGGSFSSESTVIHVDSNGSGHILTITNGTFTSEKNDAVYIAASAPTVSISGGEFITKSYVPNGNPAAATAFHVVSNCTGGTITISGGTFKALSTVRGSRALNVGSNPGISVTGGDFYSSAADERSVSSGTDGILAGGTFDGMINSNYVANGKFAYPNNDYTRYSIEDYDETRVNGLAVAKIGDTYYTSLEEAYSEITEGCAVTLLKDLDYSEKFTFYPLNNMTFDGNGHTLTGNILIDCNDGSGVARTGITIKNTKFVNTTATDGYVIRASKLSGEFTVKDCTFDNTKGQAIQCTTAAGADVTITGNTFKNGTGSKRYINLYGTGTNDTSSIDVTITDNIFYENSSTENLRLNTFGANNNLDINGNYFEAPTHSRIENFNSAKDTFEFTVYGLNNGEIDTTSEQTYIATGATSTATITLATMVAQIGDKKYSTLQSAVDAAKQIGGAVTVNIINDISGETVTIPEIANFQLTIDGQKDASSNYTVDAVIVVDGLRGNGGSTTNGASVTLQNIAFVKTTATDGIQASHYPHHLTIQDCTYSGSDNDKWFFNASVDGPLYGVTIKDVTVEHARLIYANMADDAVFQNITATNDIKVGFNVKTSGTALIENCQVTTGKYAFRDYSDGYEGTFTLKDNIFISTSEESDEGAIVNRGGAVGTAHVNVESGTYTGHVKVLNSKEGVLAISGGYFSEEFPQEYIAADLVAQGKVCAPATDKEGYFTIGDPHYVAQIGETGYVSLQAAVDAAQQIGGAVTVNIIDDISGETVTIKEVANFQLTIDGQKDASSNYTVDAVIVVDGLRGNGGSTTNGASVTLQNIAFVKTTATDGIQASHYPHHLTIQDCTYSGSDNDKWFFNASVDGPLYGVTIKDVTVEHARLIYANMADDAVFQNITATNDIKVGFNVKTSGTALIENCQVTTGKYAFRDYSDGYEGTFTLKDNIFISTSEESDEGAIVNRGGAVGTAHVNVESGTYTGHVKVLNSKEGVLAISGGYFSEEFPQEYIAADLVAQGKVCAPATDKEGYFTIGDPHYVAQIGETKYVSLQAALDAAHEMTGDVTVELIDDISGYSIVHQKAGLNLTIDGADKTLAGQVFIDGNGRASGTETLTIQNIKFEGNSSNFYSGTDAFILVPSTKDTDKPWTTGAYNYAHNITVTDCSFTSTSTSSTYDVVCFKPTSGAGAYNVVINNCAASGTKMHSLAQLTGTTGGSITNNTVTGSESFVNVSGGTGDFTISGNTFTSDEGASGYGIRENGTSTAVLNLSNNTFTATSAIVLGKGNSVTAGTINVESGTYVGDITKTDAATGKIVISGGHFSAPLADPAYAEFIAEGLCGVNGLYPDDTAAPNGIGTAVATVTNGTTVITYASLEAAFAAAVDGSTITLLKSTSGNGIIAPQGKFNTNGLTVDFGGFAYTVDGTTVGSTGTETQAFQLLKDNKITFKNGTIYSEKAKMLVQNYSDLTLEGMTLTLNNENYASAYTLSNNNGNVVIDGTTINANPAGAFAFDVCRYSSYPSVSVTVKGESVINGDVEVSASGSDAKDGFNLMFEAGTLNGKIVLDATAKAAMEAAPDKTDVSKSNALTAIAAPTDYKWVDNGDGTSSLAPCVYVAQIGEGDAAVKYETLEEAFSAATSGQTVTLLTNVELTDRLFVNAGASPAYAGTGNRYATTTEDKSVTLDLNGNNVTSSSNIALAGGSLNIVNSGTADATHGVISTSANGLAPVEIRGTGDPTAKRTLTVGEKVTLKGSVYGLNVFGTNDAQKNNIEVTVDGTVVGELFVLGNLKNDDNNIVITLNGSVDASDMQSGAEEIKTGIALNGNAKLVVNDGASVTGESGIEVRAGGLTVNGGTITATAGEYSYKPNASGTTVKGAAIAVAPYDAEKELKVTVSDGALSGAKLIAVVDVNENLEKVTVTAKDGFVDGAEETVIPDDYKWVSDGEGTGTSTLTPKTYVAQIGEGDAAVKYETLEEAFSAATSGQTVTLLTNVELTDRLFVNAGASPAYAGTGNRYATTTEDKSVTLDLNGNNVTSSSNIALAGGSLNIVNSGTADATHGVISTSANGLAPVEIRGTGDPTAKRTLTVGEKVTLKGSVYGLNVFGTNDAQKNNIEVTVDGTVVGELFVLGNLKNDDNNIVITLNGSVDASDMQSGAEEIKTGIALNGNAKLVVNDGASVTGESGIEVRAGGLTVNGGTITATAGEYSYKPNASGTTVKGAAIAVASYDAEKELKVTVSDGTLSGAKLIAVVDVQNDMEKVTVTVKDEFVDGAEETLIPQDYKWASNGDGTSTLKPCVYVAQIGEGDAAVKYESLADAVAAVPTDGTETTITMIADETVKGNNGTTIATTQNVKLDLNGKTVTLSVTESKGSQLITNRGTLTITDSSEGQTGKLTNEADESLAVGSWPTNNYVTNVITNSGTLNMEAGTVVNTANGSICYAIDNNSTSYDAILNIKGGTLTAQGTVVRQYCNSTTKQNVINMTGGVVTTNGYAAIWTQLPGSSANSKKLATLNISGGEIIASSYAWYDYSYGDSFEAVDYNISGGKFTGDIFSYAVYNGVKPGFVTGGLFSVRPESYYSGLAGYTFGPYEEDPSWYTLVPAEIDYSWVDSGTTYHDYLFFDEPFTNNYISDGEFITLLKNVTMTEDIICSLASGAFTMTFGDYAVTKGDYSLSIKAGVKVYTDKKTAIFTSPDGRIVEEENPNGGYIYSVEAGVFELVDGEPYPCPEGHAATSVTYRRTFSSGQVGKYQAWFVPVDYTIQPEDEENFQFYKIHMIAASEMAGEVSEISKINIYIEPVGEGAVLRGNRPYVVVPKKALTNHIFTAEGIDKLYAVDESSRLHEETTEFNYDFYGTYDTFGASKPHEWYAMSSGQISPNKNESAKLGSYRWYIKVTPREDNADYANISFIFVEGDGETTTIDRLIYDPNAEIEGFYTVGGIKLDKPVRGLNIVKYTDGRTKKVYIK